MKIRLGNKLYIEDAPKWLCNWCFENLVLPNPEYHKKEKMGKWLGNTPKEIILYERIGNTLCLPFGVWSENFYKMLRPETESLKSDITAFKPFDYQSSINLYDYQNDAVIKSIDKRNGVIVMPCGAGKTQTGLEIVARLGGRTLWLTHTQDLLNQSMSRAKSCFDAPLSSYGTITSGKVNIGTGITFATVQTMAKINLEEYKNVWDVLIVDECHKAIGSPTKVMQFYKVISALSCRYKYGLTATPKRSDGLHKSMTALIGDIIINVPKQVVADTTCPVKIIQIRTGYIPNFKTVLNGDGTINYSHLIDDLIHNNERYKIILQMIGKLNGATIVLANRVEYLERLTQSLHLFGKRVRCLSGQGQSKKAKEERKEALKQLNNAELDCVLATYQLAAEGLDVPNLRNLILATPEKDERIITQAVGRVGRKAEGKEYGVVYDICDNFGMLQGYERKRLGFYKKLGYELVELG